MVDRLASLLHFGYLADGEHRLPTIANDAVQYGYLSSNKQELLKMGSQALDDAIDDCLSKLPEDILHVVPLSSGLDSRTILAALNDRVSSEKILTITYGTPGTWDFKYGQITASTVGVPNISIDLSSGEFDWSASAIQASASDAPAPSRILAIHANQRLRDYVTEEDWVLWSGFLGEVSAGAHLPEEEAKTWEEACQSFVEWNQWSSLAPNNFDPTAVLPDDSFCSPEQLTYNDQLDIAVRQEHFIQPIVDQHDAITPFATPSWLEYSLNVPPEFRRDRCLFKDIVANKWPRLFEVPSDANFGQPITASQFRKDIARYYYGITSRIASFISSDYTHPGTQYMNYSVAFRDSDVLKESALEFCKIFDDSRDLESGSAREIWSMHQNGADRSIDLRAIMTASSFA